MFSSPNSDPKFHHKAAMYVDYTNETSHISSSVKDSPSINEWRTQSRSHALLRCRFFFSSCLSSDLFWTVKGMHSTVQYATCHNFVLPFW